MKKKLFEYYKSCLRIDKDNLDDELVEQPVHYQGICDEVSLAISVRDGLKKDQRDCAAEIFLEVKSGPKKVTELEANAHVDCDSEYSKLREEFILACEDVSRWEGLKEAFGQRSFALKDLVNLHTTDYFSVSSVSKDEGDSRRRINDGRTK